MALWPVVLVVVPVPVVVLVLVLVLVLVPVVVVPRTEPLRFEDKPTNRAAQIRG